MRYPGRFAKDNWFASKVQLIPEPPKKSCWNDSAPPASKRVVITSLSSLRNAKIPAIRNTQPEQFRKLSAVSRLIAWSGHDALWPGHRSDCTRFIHTRSGIGETAGEHLQVREHRPRQ